MFSMPALLMLFLAENREKLCDILPAALTLW
jgi:hypothetical protein